MLCVLGYLSSAIQWVSLPYSSQSNASLYQEPDFLFDEDRLLSINHRYQPGNSGRYTCA